MKRHRRQRYNNLKTRGPSETEIKLAAIQYVPDEDSNPFLLEDAEENKEHKYKAIPETNKSPTRERGN